MVHVQDDGTFCVDHPHTSQGPNFRETNNLFPVVWYYVTWDTWTYYMGIILGRFRKFSRKSVQKTIGNMVVQETRSFCWQSCVNYWQSQWVPCFPVGTQLCMYGFSTGSFLGLLTTGSMANQLPAYQSFGAVRERMRFLYGYYVIAWSRKLHQKARDSSFKSLVSFPKISAMIWSNYLFQKIVADLSQNPNRCPGTEFEFCQQETKYQWENLYCGREGRSHFKNQTNQKLIEVLPSY